MSRTQGSSALVKKCGMGKLGPWMIVFFCTVAGSQIASGTTAATRQPTSAEFAFPLAIAAGGVAKGKLLVASRQLGDPNFAETVILILEYGEPGAVGLIINRPTEVTLAEVLPDVKEVQQRADTIYIGGPVARDQILLLVRSGKAPEQSHAVFEDVYACASQTVLQRIITKPKAREQVRVYVGYAGWGPGQLDHEVARGDWLVVPADTKTVFGKTPSEVWPELIRRGAVQEVRSQLPENRLTGYTSDARQVKRDPYDPGSQRQRNDSHYLHPFH